MSGQLDVPDDVHISIHFVHHVRPVHHAHTERVHCGFGFVPAQSSDQPATKLKSLIDSNTDLRHVWLRRATDGIRSGPLTANLQGVLHRIGSGDYAQTDSSSVYDV
jgi:hypothetical protein